MKGTPVSPEALKMLPEAIVMTRDASVYRGSPVEMVRQMANEMKPGMSVPQAVQALLTSIGFKRGILIAIPEDCPEDMLCALFVHALLDTGISEPVH